MCNKIIINGGDKEIETIAEFEQHFGFLPCKEPNDTEDFEMDCCLCQADIEGTFKMHKIPFEVIDQDWYINCLETKTFNLKNMEDIKVLSTALVMRIVNGANGEKVLQIFGTGLEIPEQIKPNQDYLVLGSLSFDAKHIFKGFMFGEGKTPDNMITGGGLNHKNYTEKIL